MEFITEKERIYANDANGNLIAEITFPTKNGISTIDHTFVDHSLRGQGMGEELMRGAVKKILSDGNRIAATCPYAVLWLQRHPEFTTVDTAAPVACRIDKKR